MSQSIIPFGEKSHARFFAGSEFLCSGRSLDLFLMGSHQSRERAQTIILDSLDLDPMEQHFQEREQAYVHTLSHFTGAKRRRLI